VNEAANKRLALEWVAASVAGDVAKVRALYAPDCRFLVAGDMPYCGWMDLEAFFKQTALLPLDGPITMEIGDVTAEGDRVWFEAQSSARLKDGSKYENAYVFFMRIRAGAIVEYKEFVDTYYVYRLIDSPQTRGEPQPRYRIFDQASQSYSGNAIGEAVRGQGTQPQR
jgi:ketosteroid isomerase-like protein